MNSEAFQPGGIWSITTPKTHYNNSTDLNF